VLLSCAGNFTSVATISPYFGGVAGAPGVIVYPSNMSDCVRAAAITHGCYGGYGGCHNETSHHCLHPNCATHSTPSTMTFMSGKDVPAPASWMPPWTKVLPCGVGRDGPIPPPSADCTCSANTALTGGQVPAHWGSVQMQWPSPKTAGAAQAECCGYCHADPLCQAGVITGAMGTQTCVLYHKDKSSGSPKTLTPVNRSGAITCIRATQWKSDDYGTVLAAAAARSQAPPPQPLQEAYPVFWDVGGTNKTMQQFYPGGTVDLAQYGIKTTNWTIRGGLTGNSPQQAVPHSGAWPEIGTDGTLNNGGVPQNVNQTFFIEMLTLSVNRLIPDPDFAGLAPFDFESCEFLPAAAPPHLPAARC
jgi:hypothetical protein